MREASVRTIASRRSHSVMVRQPINAVLLPRLRPRVQYAGHESSDPARHNGVQWPDTPRTVHTT